MGIVRLPSAPFALFDGMDRDPGIEKSKMRLSISIVSILNHSARRIKRPNDAHSGGLSLLPVCIRLKSCSSSRLCFSISSDRALC